MALTEYIVDRPFPGPVPQHEGAVLEVWPDGLACLIQMPNLTRPERQAFKKSFKRYSYAESTTPIPIALWVFDFPKPFGVIDCNFDARKYVGEHRKVLDTWLLPEGDNLKNVINFFLLDGQILKAQKMVGLDSDAINLFHITLRKQLSMDYAEVDYARYLEALFQYSSEELMQMGTIFKHRRKGFTNGYPS